MHVWQVTPQLQSEAYRRTIGELFTLQTGTWPIESGQSVWIKYRVQHLDNTYDEGNVEAIWQQNDSINSYWKAYIGPFARGDRVTYEICGVSTDNEVKGPSATIEVKPRIYLALLWHQHQPVYKDTSSASQKGSYIHPWVRLHSIRDYYSMAALVAQHPDIHLTINLTPALLWQIEDYLQNGATDYALELTVKPAKALTSEEREHLLAKFFDAHWHNQIFPHSRYKELFIQRAENRSFSTQDLRDLQMWSNLAWFGKEFREGEVRLATGEVASVRRLIHKTRNFTEADIRDMIEEQYKIMKAIVPVHRELQQRGQIEVSTTPYYHPILPLLIDTDKATIDRTGTRHPHRFAHPEDAEAQVQLATEYYYRQFGQAPRGMWPAEGAVSQFAVPFFSRHGVRWIATDRGVLAKSGRWGYEVDNADVLCQPYRAEEGADSTSIFFRDQQLSDGIGFHYQDYTDYKEAAQAFLREIKERFALRVTQDKDHVLTVVLDGENAWGAYRDDGRPFLNAFYDLLKRDAEVQTVTFGEYLEGSSSRGVSSHPKEEQARVYELFTGSWIDENGSAPGVDLGTWIGEDEENKAWELLGNARDFLSNTGATPETSPDAFEALYIAEGSDWFWWYGEDQDSGNDEEFDDLFRTHLKNVYRRLGTAPPEELDRHIVPHVVVWSFSQQTARIERHDRFAVHTNCPGTLTWRLGERVPQTSEMLAVGGVMAGIQRYQLTLGPFPSGISELRFSFHCTHKKCECNDICCKSDEYSVRIS